MFINGWSFCKCNIEKYLNFYTGVYSKLLATENPSEGLDEEQLKDRLVALHKLIKDEILEAINLSMCSLQREFQKIKYIDDPLKTKITNSVACLDFLHKLFSSYVETRYLAKIHSLLDDKDLYTIHYGTSDLASLIGNQSVEFSAIGNHWR